MFNLAQLSKIFFLSILIVFIVWVNNAQAVTVNFEWQGSTGYKAKGTLSYDEETVPKIITEQGEGTTNYVDNFSISIYNSEDQLIAAYDNVKNKLANGKYFQLNFNTQTKQLIGKIDVGGESSGEIYLKGKVKEGLSLFQVTKLNSDMMLDQGSGQIKMN